ncbi:hypothetical protein [Lysobacter humi (ex Lee et al. 2017)]
MQDASSAPPLYSRSELELELGRLALAIMRAAPDAFELEAPELAGPMTAERFAKVADELLTRTRDEHRGFVIARLRELADSSAGLRLDGFERDAFTIPRPGAGTGPLHR